MAGLNEIAKWEREVYQIEEDDPVLGGVEGVTNKPLKHLANRTLYLKQVLETAGQKLMPKKLTATTRNTADSTGHTHEIDLASTTTKGLVQLTNDTGLDSDVLALTAKAGKAIAQSVAQLQLSTTNALNQKVNKTDISNSVTSTSQTTVASSQAVKTAYDKGVEAKNAADAAQRTADAKYTAVNASITQKGLVQLTNDTGLDSDVLALTAKAGKAIAQSVAQLQINTNNALNNKINKADISDSVSSTSQTTVASSKAAKTAYDKGVEAKNAADAAQRTANAKQSPATTLAGYGITDFIVKREPNTANARNLLVDGIYAFSNGGMNLPINGAFKVLNLGGGNAEWRHQLAIKAYSSEMYLSSQVSSGSDEWLPWKRIDGADWQDIRNNPLTLAGSILTFNGQYLGVSVSNNGYGGINIKRQGSVGNWDSRLEALPDKRWKFWTQGAFDVYIPAKAGTVVLDTDGAVDATENTYVKRDAESDVIGRLFRATYQDENRIQGAIAFRVNNSNDNYTRYCNNPAAIRTWLGLKEGVENFCQKTLATSNLNDVMIPGIYGQNADINATSTRNYPEAQAGSLIVSLSAYGVQQEYTTYSSKNKYVRGRLNSAWTAWKRIDGADWSEVRNKPTVSRRDYSRTIQGTNPNWDSGNTKNISVTGFVEVYPDGSVEQYFYFRNFRIHWFNFEKQVGALFRLPEIPVQLWTAMPNKISWVEAHLSRTNDTNIWSERTIGSEAAEWTTPSWAFEKQNGVKDRVNLYTRRLAGDTDETVDMMVKVRGY